MKKPYSLTCFIFIFLNLLSAQVIQIHSIADAREPSIGDTGYTLDGSHMDQTATAKLQNIALFGTIYPKTINITHAYSEPGSLELINFTPDIDLFIFGTFNKLDPAFIQFTTAEIDSIYEWSKNGGKMILGASVALPVVNFDPSNLNEKWGFDIAPSDPFVPMYATSEGQNSTLYDGPFGTISESDPPYQGGGAQGYFSAVPEGAVVLAEDDQGNPTLILDCNTLDLIISDFDTYTDLGGVSFGGSINNSNDILWTNSIAYMDELQDPPSITVDGATLTTGEYESYQWYLDGQLIPDATQSTLTAVESGAYSVEVDMSCGCNYTSNSKSVVITNTAELILNDKVSVNPNPVTNQLNLNFILLSSSDIELSIYNQLGQLILDNQQHLSLSAGEYNIPINVNSLAKGIYQISLSTTKGIKSLQFTKL